MFIKKLILGLWQGIPGIRKIADGSGGTYQFFDDF
jgi:hypothetical protein